MLVHCYKKILNGFSRKESMNHAAEGLPRLTEAWNQFADALKIPKTNRVSALICATGNHFFVQIFLALSNMLTRFNWTSFINWASFIYSSEFTGGGAGGNTITTSWFFSSVYLLLSFSLFLWNLMLLNFSVVMVVKNALFQR